VVRWLRTILVGFALLLGSTAAATATIPHSDESAAAPATVAPVRVLVGEYRDIALALDSAGNRHLVAGSRRGDLWYATDRTGTWVTELILAGDYLSWAWSHPAVAIDDDQHVHVAVVREDAWSTPGGTHGIYYLTDAGRALGDFGPPSKITGDSMTSPSLKVVDGVRYLAYATCACAPMQRSAPLYFKTDRSGSWQTERIDDWASAPSLRVARDGRAHIAYEDEDGLRYTSALTKAGGFTAPARIAGTKGRPGEPSLALDRSDRPRVAWAAWDEGDPVLYAEQTASGWQTPLQLDSGWTSDLSIDAAGRPHVVLARGYARGTVVHRWLDAGTWKLQTIADRVSVGDVAVRAFGKGVTIAWGQDTKPKGVWVGRY
jgi:hypothetical protein